MDWSNKGVKTMKVRTSKKDMGTSDFPRATSRTPREDVVASAMGRPVFVPVFLLTH